MSTIFGAGGPSIRAQYVSANIPGGEDPAVLIGVTPGGLVIVDPEGLGVVFGGAVSLSVVSVVNLTVTGTITSTQGALVASAPFLSQTATWNNAAVTFVNELHTITDTASAAASELERWVVGGSTRLAFRKDGSISNTGTFSLTGITITQGNFVGIASGGQIRFNNNGSIGSLTLNTNANLVNVAGDIPVIAMTGMNIVPGAGSATFAPVAITYTINAGGAQTGSVTGIRLVATETALNGITHKFIELFVGAASRFLVSNAGALTTAAGIVAVTGDIVATAGAMSAGTTVTAGTGLVATTGSVTAAAGNIVATLGNITATAGGLAAPLGNVDGATYSVGGVPGVSGAITALTTATVVNGLITAIV